MGANSNHAPLHRLTPELAAQLRAVPLLDSINDEDLNHLADTPVVELQPGQALFQQGEVTHNFWIVLSGSLRLSYVVQDGTEHTAYVYEQGAAFGEVGLLASIPSGTSLHAIERSEILQFSENQFWEVMNFCPEVRKTVLGNMAYRLAKLQVTTFQQEKLASLGTLAAGLMHELNNPGAAARRASSQLRENLTRMHQLSAAWAKSEHTPTQKECLYELQNHALSANAKPALNSLEQADAEDVLSDWMSSAGVPDAWKLAPTLVSVGIDAGSLGCARERLNDYDFADALNWLEAMVSSMQLVGTIEESIGRVTELVGAVKRYAYEGRGQKQAIDINDSIHNTVVILAHKLREKQITLEKSLAPNLPPLETGCQGLNQVWTNLLDNAIDASPAQGRIGIKTWAETVSADRQELCILITDYGEGIPVECQTQIFDPFFTTKPVGVGTGLGLGIVYRIVEQCGGTIHFSSSPGETEFAIRLPVSGEPVSA